MFFHANNQAIASVLYNVEVKNVIRQIYVKTDKNAVMNMNIYFYSCIYE